MQHLELNKMQLEHGRKLMPVLHLYKVGYADTELKPGRDRRMGIGNAIEHFCYALLSQRYNAGLIQFDLDKTFGQMQNGADGKTDSGYDIRLTGLTYDYKIDCKLQDCLKDGYVDMGLVNSYGYEQFALSGKCTHSAHFYLQYTPASKVAKMLAAKYRGVVPKEYHMSIVFVDLTKFRTLLKEDNGRYVAGPYAEHKASVSNDRLIKVNVEWLVNNGCALSYKLKA